MFVDITQQCFALLPQVNFPAKNLNFHWVRRWWDRIQAIFLNLFDFTYIIFLQITHPDENQFDSVLLWLESLLEAHYSTFVVAKDENSTAILQETLDLLNNLDQNINLLASVMAQTKIMKKKLAVQQTKNVNLMYSVEIVYFWIPSLVNKGSI